MIKIKKFISADKQVTFISRQGFTLMEVVLVIGIIAIMTSVALVYIGGSRKNKTEVKSATNEVVSAIRETQNYSLTGNVSSGSNCVEYRFSTTTGTSNYSITGHDDVGNNCGFNVNYKISGEVNFVGGVLISFTAPHGKNSPDNVTVALQKGTERRYVCLNDVGLVTNNGSNPSCP